MTRFSSSRSDRIPILKTKNGATIIVSLSRPQLIATHTTSQSYSHSINPKRLVINAGDTDHRHPTTHTHARALILGKRTQKKHFERHAESQQDEERERRKKCEFQRMQHIYFNLIQRLAHCSSPYAFYTHTSIHRARYHFQ